MNVYISRNYKNTDSAGNKAKTDMETIMKNEGFKNVGLCSTSYQNATLAFIINLIGVIKGCINIKHGDILFLQYPLKKYFTFICVMAHIKGVKVVVLIHDLGSFRRKRLSVSQEITRLNHADYIIASNPTMRKWLILKGCSVPIGSLGIWDYLSTAHQTIIKASSPTVYTVAYAGVINQRKNSFLPQWEKRIMGYNVNLYGKYSTANSVNEYKASTYKGFIKPDELIKSIDGDFGLVWDGDSIDTCSGDFGEYLRFNNPHKTSLYIRCGLPIIIWKEAALAPFIEENNAGILIDSLNEIEEKLATLTTYQYNKMKKNVDSLSKKLSVGYYFVCAAKQAVSTLTVN